MTEPLENPAGGVPLAPADRGRGRTTGRRARSAAEPPEEIDDLADLERGRTAALLSTLGRMQLRLDLLAREQREGIAALQASLAAIEARLDAADAGSRSARPTSD